MQNIIRIKKAVFYAYHGVLSEEQSVGGKFEADIDIYTDFSAAAKHDSLRETIDYVKAYKLIYDIALSEKYYLLEALANKMADAILKNFNNVEKTAIKIRKNNPPLGGVVDFVEIEIIKEKKDLLNQ
ncbi:MAG: dihydroneopterin aldolase [Syntrophothermus sp.]|nr:dihydroneopterin aldolase [Ignavibacteriaceae bacterium]